MAHVAQMQVLGHPGVERVDEERGAGACHGTVSLLREKKRQQVNRSGESGGI
jgi:hypothetical protein